MLSGLLALDGNLLLWIQEFVRVDVLNPIAAFYTHLGDSGLLWIASSLVMLCFRRTRRAGVLGLLALALGALFTNVVLKHLVARPRPWLTVEGLRFLVVEPDPNSFPSGHTCAAFSAAGAWFGALSKRWMGITALVLAALMGLSRLYVGVHFPSDVLAGALVGLFAAWLAGALWRRLEEKKGRALV